MLFLITNQISFDVDIKRDETIIRKQFMKKHHSASLATKYPYLAKEWMTEKNDKITPDMVTSSSTMNAWWKGPCGHTWQAKVYSRIKGSGCPYCSEPAKKVLTGFNDLATKYPEIAKEWDVEKNSIKPSEVLPGSNHKYWWICPICNKSYLTSPSHRKSGSSCPKCGHKRTNESKNRRVKNLDTNEVFKSMSEAVEKYNLQLSNLTKCCKGQRNTCGGYRWKYID